MVDLTVGKLPKAVAATIIGDSLISEAAGAISVASLLHVYGDVTLHGATSGTLAMRAPTIAGTSVITWPVGTTNFTATGGTGRVLRQSTVGGAITVGTIATADVTGLAPIATSGSAADLTAGIVPSARVSGAYTGITSVGTLTAGIWNASTIGLAYGGTQANLSATGGTGQVLRQSTAGGAITVAAIASSDVTGLAPIASSGSASDLSTGTVPSARIAGAYTGITSVGTLTAGVWNGTAVGLAYGGTGANLSATGGAGQVLKQLTVGGAITVAALTPTDVGVAGAYLPLVGGTLSGNLAITLAAGNTGLALGSIAGAQASTSYNTAGTQRWILGKTNVAEGGANAGSDFGLQRYNDAGTFMSYALLVERATGRLGINFGVGVLPQSLLHVGASNATARTYQSFTDAANGTWAYLGDWSKTSTVATFGTDQIGTGTAWPVALMAGGVEAMRISTLGEIAVGFTTTPQARLHVATTYTTANPSFVTFAGTLASSLTTTQSALTLSTVFAPTGASLSQFIGVQLSPSLNTTALTVAAGYALWCDVAFGAGFTGTVTTMNGIAVDNITGSVPGQLPNLRQFSATAITNGNGLTTGSLTNIQYLANGITSGAAGGSLYNRSMYVVVPSGGASAGATGNIGLYITGNGGTSTGGSVQNNAIFSDSTAPSLLSGLLQFSGSTASFPALKRSTTTLQIRLADDSGYGGLTAGSVAVAGQLLAGTTTGYNGPGLWQRDAQFYANLGVQIARHSADTFGSALVLTKSRNATVGSHTTTLAGDTIAQVQFSGSDGTNYVSGTQIIAAAAAGIAAGIVPMSLALWTMNTVGTSAPRLTVSAAGGVYVGLTPVDSGVNNLAVEGDLGVGIGVPLGRLHIAGTYTSANQGLVYIGSTLASSNTGNNEGMRLLPYFTPTGASLYQFMGLEIWPSISSTAFALTNAMSCYASFGLVTPFSGTVTNGFVYYAAEPNITGGSLTNYNQFYAGGITTLNNARATGTYTHTQFGAAGITVGSAGSTVHNRGITVTVPAGGSTAGATNNRGIYITGNGGTAAGGAVNNFALFSDSTAPMQIGGTFQFLGSTASFPMLKRSATALQVRLADDSGDAPLTCLYIEPSAATGLTAVGTSRSDALFIGAQINNVTTAAAGTGVKLQSPAVVGMMIDIFLSAAVAAASIKVYTAGASDTIDGIAGTTGVTLTKGNRCRYFCVAANTWISAMMGAASA